MGIVAVAEQVDHVETLKENLNSPHDVLKSTNSPAAWSYRNSEKD
jgi:hypothetical protein